MPPRPYSSAYYQRILELHSSGLTPKEIASKILTPEPEIAMFRAEILIVIIVTLANRHGEEKKE